MAECKPLMSLEEVLEWREKNDWASFVLPLKPKTQHCFSGSDFICCDEINSLVKISRDRPKTLVCHDMKGGYLNDSHYLVTIPPLMWINAGHKHGVQILGTFITEFKNGEKFWEQLFENDEKLFAFADMMCAICAHYRFDGYLINIENKINSSNLTRLLCFLRRLKQNLRDDCVLIWYDSVSLISGELAWKNELNEHNKDAFMICDGIFLNYTWKIENLRCSSLRAGARQHDVYVGIDVFGRGCFCGGGYNCDKAAAIARAYGLSLALFGIGWTHEVETNQLCMSEDKLCEKMEHFKNVERKFWSKLWPFLYVSGPAYLPFRTAFCQGFGNYLFDQGAKMNSLSWYNLSTQCYQPSITFCLNDNDNSCVSFREDDGYLYGGCIFIKNIENVSTVCNLFTCDFSCKKDQSLLLSVASKWPSLCEPFKIICIIEKNYLRGSIYVVVHHPEHSELTPQNVNNHYDIWTDASRFVSSLKCNNDWFLSKFLLKFHGRITAIKLETNQNILLGLLSIEYSDIDETEQSVI